MQQPEKQKTLEAYVKKHFSKTGYEIKEAVKDTIKIFTSDKSIVFKCKNNGEVIEISSRLRRGRNRDTGVQGIKNTPKKVSADKDPVKPQKSSAKKPVAVKPIRKRAPKPAESVKTAETVSKEPRDKNISPEDKDDDEDFLFKGPSPNPYLIGDSVELLYGNHPAFTVEEVISNTCRVITSQGEPMEYIIAASDLRKSRKKARKLDSEKAAGDTV
ncbi:MAG: hypothetical protein ACI4CS_05790 [Candidatus Weimeria sp.]